MQIRADAIKLAALGLGPPDPGPGPGPSPPAIVDAPALTVNGSVATRCAVGDNLACTVGNWTNEPTDYWQSWLAGSSLVGNGPAYTVQAADDGQSISCSVTATNAAGSTNAMSNAVLVGP